MSLRVGDLLWIGDVLPSTREICSIRQGSCFNKYPAKVSHPPPTRTMTCLLCSIWNERRRKALHSENPDYVRNQAPVLGNKCCLSCISCLIAFVIYWRQSAGGLWEKPCYRHASGCGFGGFSLIFPLELSTLPVASACFPKPGLPSSHQVVSLSPRDWGTLCIVMLTLPPICDTTELKMHSVKLEPSPGFFWALRTRYF